MQSFSQGNKGGGLGDYYRRTLYQRSLNDQIFLLKRLLWQQVKILKKFYSEKNQYLYSISYNKILVNTKFL